MSRSAVCWAAAVMTLCTSAQADHVTFPICPNHNKYGGQLRVLGTGTYDVAADHLFLNDCHLTEIKAKLFFYTPNLRYINLKSNKLGHLPPDMFLYANKTEQLILNDNNLRGKYLHPRLFHQCTSLKKLHFSGNNMADAPRELLRGLDLKVLNLDDCSLRQIPEFLTSPSFPNMRALSLTKNLIVRLENSETFSCMLNLTYIMLSYNQIEYVNEDVFKRLIHLQMVKLNNNKIKNIPKKLFQNNPRLESLFLADNVIEYVTANAFRGTALTYLDLNGNRLTYLPDNFWMDLRDASLTQIFYFDHNPWQCACLNDILVEVKRFGVVYKSTRYRGDVPVCVMQYAKCIRDDCREIYDNLLTAE